MQKFLRTLTLLALIAVPWVAQAQGNYAKVSEYDFEVSHATYTSIVGTTGAEELTLTGGTATVALPWTIHFGETELAATSNITVNRNGSISFAGLTNSVVAPMRIPGTISGGKVYKKSTATELVIEWRKIVGGSNSYSFQLAIANNGDIEFRYGPATLASTSVNVAVGLASDTTNTTPDRFNVSMVSSRWDSISRTTTSWSPNRSVANYYSSTHPAYSTATGQGVVYTFTQPACVKPASGSVTATDYWDALNVTWDTAGAAKYEVFYTDNATLVPTETTSGTEVLATTPGVLTNANGKIRGYRLGGLNYNTKYYVYVRKYCGTTPSGWLSVGNATTANISTSNFSLSAAGLASWDLTYYPTVNAVQLYYTTTQVADMAALANVTPQVTVLKSDSVKYDLALRQTLESNTKYYVYYRLRYTQGDATKYVWVNVERTFKTPFDGDTYIMGTNADVTTCNAVIYDEGGASGQYGDSKDQTLIIRPGTDDSFVRLHGDYTTESGYDYIYVYAGVGTTGTELLKVSGASSLDITSTDITTGALTLRFTSDGSGTRDGFALYATCVPMPACTNPTDLAVTLDGVATWTAGRGNTSYFLKWGETGFDPETEGTAVNNLTATTHTLTGLGSNITYDVYVRANCADEDAWVGPVTFTTPCLPMTVTLDNPYVEGFESTTFPSDCWQNFHVSGPGTNVWQRSTFYKHSGSACAQIPDMNATTLTNFVAPPMAIGANEANAYAVEFWMYRNSTGSYHENEGVRVWASHSNSTSDPDAVLLMHAHRYTDLDPVVSSTGWYKYESTIPLTGTVYIIFEGVCEYGSASYMDDITIYKIPSCVAPSNLAAVPSATATSVSAVLNWTENSPTPATQWEVRYAPAGKNLDTFGVSVLVTEKPDTLNNLDMATTYKWMVRSLCNTEDVSDWSDSSSFSTKACLSGPISLGENTGNSDYLPFNGYYKYSVTEQIYTPAEISTTPTTINSISYNVITANTANRNPVDIYLLETDKESFSSASTASEWVSVVGLTPNYTGVAVANSTGWKTINLTTPFNYSGQHNLLVVFVNRTGSYNSHEYIGTVPANGNQAIYAYQDGSTVLTPANASTAGNKNVLSVKNNFIFNIELPCDQGNCLPPTAELTPSQVTNGELTIAFDGDDDYGYICVQQGTDITSLTGTTATTDEVTLTGLTPGASYDVYVYSVCPGVDNPRMVRYGVTMPVIPDCKAQTGFAVSNVTYTSATVTWAQVGGATPANGWTVRYSDVEFVPATAASTEYTEVHIDGAATATLNLTGLHNGKTYYIHTMADCGELGANDVWADYSFQIPAIATPMWYPSNSSWATTNISDSLRWMEATAGINSWTVRYNAGADFDPEGTDGLTLAATTTKVKLENLAPATKYYVYVRANSGDEHSAWSAQHTFSTLCPEPTEEYTMTSGTSTLVTDRAMIYDNGGPNGNYSNSWTGTVIIKPATDGAMVHLEGGYITESGYDKITVYNGEGTTGTKLHDAVSGNGTIDAVSTDASGALTLSFSADVSNSYSGFALFASVGPCNTNITCFAPVALKAEKDSSNNVTLSWEVNNNLEPVVNNFEVAYGEKDFADGATDIAAVAIETLEVNNYDTARIAGTKLEALTEYDFYVRTDCGDDNSRWAKVSLETYPEVFAPKSLAASTLFDSKDSVALSWVEKNPVAATTWQVAYGPAGFDIDDTNAYQVQNISSTSAVVKVEGSNVNDTVLGLKHSTKYDFYVRAVKGNNVSPWSNKASKTTDCGVWTLDDLPLTENFDSYSTYKVPNCWSRIGNSYSNTSDSKHKSGERSLSLYGSTSYKYTAILPELDKDLNVSQLTLTFNGYLGSTSGISIGVMTDKTNADSFDTVAVVTPTTTGTWQNYQVDLAAYANHTKHDGHTGTRYVAIRANNGYSSYIDDVVLKETEPTQWLDATGEYQICNMYVRPDTTNGGMVYHNGVNATYTLRPKDDGKVLHLTGSVDMEDGYDFLSLYRGSVAPANLIGTYTGKANIDYKTGSNLWADSGSVVLVMTTDGDNGMNYEGFKFFVQCECPEVCDTVQQVNIDTNTLFVWTAPQGNNETYEKTSATAHATDLVVDLTGKNAYRHFNIGQCDSIHKELHLVLHPAYEISYSGEICERDTFHVNKDGKGFYGKYYTETGNYSDTLKTVYGADSIGILALQRYDAPEAYIYNNNVLAGDTVANWCDNAEIALEGRANVTATYQWEDSSKAALHTVTPHESGTYTVVATDVAHKCTSLPVSVVVTTTPVADLSVSATDTVICRGESTTLTLADANNVAASYRWTNNRNNTILTGNSITVTPDSTTTYTVTATTSNASKCQTNATFTVTVNQLPEVQLTTLAEVCRDSALTLSATAVDGYTYLWSNNATTASTTVNPTVTATYSVTVTETATGCVNEFTTNPVTVNPSYTVADTMEVCYTQNPYTWGAQTLTADGDYTQNFKIAHGCDSLVNVNFAFKAMSTINTRRELCEGAAYTWGGITRNANLDTTVHYESTPVDCPVDSVLMLTVNHPDSSSFDKTVCDSYTWVIAGDTIGTYTTTNAYSTTLATTKGCDSTVTMNLTVNRQNAGTDVQNVCDELEWIDGKVYTNDTVGAQYTLKNQHACDSVVTLNLTLRHSTEGDTTVKVCDSRSFTWTAKDSVIGTYKLTDVSGNIRATFAGQAANGCDTTAVLLLTMHYVSDTLNWVNVTVPDVFYLDTIDCDGNEGEKAFRYSQDVQERIRNASGIDQWYRAHLTVNTSENHTDLVSACVPYVFGLVYWEDTTTHETGVMNKDDYYAASYDSARANDTVYLNTLEDKTNRFHKVAELNADGNVSFNTSELGYDHGASDLIWQLRFTAKYPVVKDTLDTICYTGNNYTWTSPKNVDYNFETKSQLTADQVNIFEWDRKKGKAANGCDSIFNVKLMVHHATNDATDTLTLCESEFVLNADSNLVDTIYNPNNDTQFVVLTIPAALNEVVYPATGDTTITTKGWTTAMGCDSNVTYHYTVLPTVRKTVKDTACREYVWDQNGKTYKKNGDYIDTIVSERYGCDSIVTLQLTIYDTVKQHTYDTVCTTYMGPDSNIYRVDSTFAVLKGKSRWGCDTIVYKHYIVRGMRTVYQNVITNTDYVWNGDSIKASVSGLQYDATLPNGCDSVVILNLTRVPAISLCESALPYSTGYGVVIPANATSDTIKNKVVVNDTIFDTVINYTVNATVTNDATKDTVKCDSFTYKDSTYTASTIIRDTMTSVVTGCDSILVFNLVINKSTDSVHTQVACDSYTWAGKNFKASGDYVIDTNATGDFLKNADHCDSTATLHLTINTNTPVKTKAVACGEYYWIVANNDFAGNSDTLGKYTASDSVVLAVQDVNGCETSDTLVLTINAGPVAANDTIVVNTPTTYYKNVLFTAPFKSDTVTDAEMQKLFVDTLYAAENTGACDTILTHLFVVEIGTLVDDTVLRCGRYTWMNNHTYEWIPVAERVNGNPIFNYKDVTTNAYIQENPMYTTYTTDPTTGDSVIDKTYVLWLTMSEATMADSVYEQFPLSQKTLTIGDSTFNFAAYKALKKDTTVNREVHYGSTYYCDSIEYWTIHLKYNYDTVDTTYLCYSDLKAAGQGVGKENLFMLNDTTGKGTNAEMVHTTKYIRMPELKDSVALTACDSIEWNGAWRKANATYTTTKVVNGVTCDSTVTLKLTVINTLHNVTSVEKCPSELANYAWNGKTGYTETAVDTFQYKTTETGDCWNVDTLKLTVKPTYAGTDTKAICAAQLPYTWNGVEFTKAGIDTATLAANQNGCDSVVVMTLTVNDTTHGDTTAVACNEFIWHGTTYTASTITPSYTMTGANQYGCDSIVFLHLTVYNTSVLTHDTIDVRGGSYRFQGHLYQAPTINDSVDITLKNENGCDSVVRYHIWVQQYEIDYDNVVECGLYTWPVNNHTYQWISDEDRAANGNALYKDFTTGEYVHSFPFDTVDIALRYLNLTLNEAAFGDTTVVRFPLSQDSLILGNDTFHFEGFKTAKKDTTVNVWFSAGHNYYCDSLVYATVNLVYNYNTENENVCFADSVYSWNGKNHQLAVSTTNTFTDTLNRGTAAEQVTTKKVYRRAFSGSTDDTNACDSYQWTFVNAANNWDTTIITGGTYEHIFTDVNGCDSVVTMTVNMFHDMSTAYYDTVCDKKSWHDSNYTTTGTYYYSYKSNDAGKCASVDTLYLVVNKNLGFDTAVVACDSYKWHGEVRTVTGTYKYDSVDANLCHHMDTIALTINKTTHYDSVIWAGEGSYRYKNVMYTADVNLFDTALVKNAAGCDSIYDVYIHVGTSYYATDDTIVCSEYTWRDGNTYEWISDEERTANNAIYKNRTTGAYVTYMPTYVKQNLNDYDSIYTLNLTLTQRYISPVKDTTFFVSNKTLVYGDSTFDYTAQNTRAHDVLGFSDSTFILNVTYSQPTVKQYCDSVIVLNVTLKNNYVDSGDVHICVSDQSYTWRGHTQITSTSDYDHAHGPWRIYDTLATGYIAYVTVYQHPFTYSTDRRTVCDSYTWVDKVTYTESTSTPTYDTVDQYGCDSILSLVLTIKHNSSVFTDTTAHCGEYTWKTVDGHEFTFDHSVDTAYNYTATNGCPSKDSLHFVYNKIYNVAVAETACDKYDWEGYVDPATNKDTVILKNGTYKHTFQSAAGCDSTVTLTLTVNHNSNAAEYDTTYFGDTYTWHGREYTEGTAKGVVTDTFSYKTISGCPSVDTLYLTMYNGVKVTTGIECDSYKWNDTTFTVADLPADTDAWTFYYMNKSKTGKNLSQDTIVLTLHQSTVNYDTVAACKSYSWNGMTSTNSTNAVKYDTLSFTHTELNEAGCPIIDTLYLTLGTGRTFVYQDTTSCGPYVWTVNGKVIDTLTESMQTSANVPTATGCDSVINLTLTVYEQPVKYESAVICDNYEMPYEWRGKSYTAAVEDDTVHTHYSAQCDSIIHFTLTVNQTAATPLTAQICLGNGYQGYNFDIAASELTESGEYTFVDSLKTNNGCDSVVTLTLTVGTVLTGDTSALVCDSLVWHGETYTTSGNYTYKTATLGGCDSVVTLALTVNNSNTGVDEQTVCNSFTWIDGVTYTESNNTATYTLTNAAGCDSVVTLNLTITNSTTGDTTAVACSYFEWHGQAYTQSGDYTYTMTNGEGCDSVVTLHLTINQPVATAISESVCGSYIWNGVTYTTSGNYSQTLTAENGCDSVVTLTLTVNQPVTGDTTAVACNSFAWHGETYTTSGNYTDTLTAANNCDSIVTLHLTVNASTYAAETATACDSYSWNGETYTIGGNYTYSYTNAEGCASVDTLHLTINYNSNSDTSVVVCNSYVWNNATYTTGGVYTYSYVNADGCASVDTLHLTILQPVANAISESACESYTWNGDTYTATGTYQQTFTAENGCDSTVTMTLVINQPLNTTESEVACGSYTWNGTTYTASGAYTHNFTDANGCAATATLNLTINNGVSNIITASYCGSYEWNGQTYYGSGSYQQVFAAANGCDSTVTLNLTINQPSTAVVTYESCTDYVWNGQTCTTSGVYTHTTTNAAGCDSVVTLFFTRLQSVATTVNATACDSYEWNGQTYTTSGNYPHSYTASNGCDSLVTLVLTINQSVTNAITASSCGEYTWNNDTYTTSGTYSQTLTARNGCDSTVTLTLTVNQPLTETVEATACSSYEWNGETYTTSGNYTYTTTGSNGCDSTVTLILTVNMPVNVTLDAEVVGSYNWNGETLTESGVYTYTTTAANGCDSVVTLNLTVIPVYTVTLVSANEAMGTVSESGTAEENGYFTARAYANEGYDFVAWMNGTDTVSHDATYIFQVTEDITLTAIFKVHVGINDVDMDNVTIYSSDSRIFVNGAEGHDVYVFDVNGRTIARQSNAADAIEFRMTTTGVYLVKVGNAPAKRVIVVR